MSVSEGPYIVCDESNTDEWLEHRQRLYSVGGISASDAPCLVHRGYKGFAALLRERIFGETPEVTPFLQQLFDRGHDLEPYAIRALEQHLGVHIRTTGFWRNSRVPGWGATPDGLHSDFVVECKAPQSTVIDQKKFGRYCVQAQVQMMVLEKKMAWIVIYHDTEIPICWSMPYSPKLARILTQRLQDYQHFFETRLTPPRAKQIPEYIEWEFSAFNKWGGGRKFIKLKHPADSSHGILSSFQLPQQNMSLSQSSAISNCPICGDQKVEKTCNNGENTGKRYRVCGRNCKGSWEPVDEFPNKFGYAKKRDYTKQSPPPQEDVKEAIKRVFDDGMESRFKALESKVDDIMVYLNSKLH